MASQQLEHAQCSAALRVFAVWCALLALLKPGQGSGITKGFSESTRGMMNA